MTESRRIENFLGAIVIGLTDRVHEALEESLGARENAAAALMSVGARPLRSVEDLARVLGLSHSATVRVVDKLEEAGWVRRTRAPDDRRAVLLGLTSSGSRNFRRLLAARHRVLSESTARLTAREREVLGTLLFKMLSDLPGTVEEARRICRLCEHRVCSGEDCPVGSSVSGE